MKLFDQAHRQLKKWSGWEENKAHKYAIENSGRRYPVKKIISIATGLHVSEFGEGKGDGADVFNS